MDPQRRQVLAAFAEAISMNLGDFESHVVRETELDQDAVAFFGESLIQDGFLARGAPKRDGSGRIYDRGRLQVTAKGRRELQE